jgi:hypothetical protein
MWNIVKNNSNIKSNINYITSIKVNGNLSRNGQIITNAFSKYFASVVQNNHHVNDTPNCENPITYLSKAFNQPFPTIKFKMCII